MSPDAPAAGRTDQPNPPAAPGDARRSILIVDDHEVVREGYRLIIAASADLFVCADVEDVRQARHALIEHSPDIAIVDLALRGGSGLELVQWIKQQGCSTRAIVASMHEEELFGERALRAGAAGYVAKSAPARSMLTAIRRVLDGGLYFSKELTDRVLRRAADPQIGARPIIDRLSNRELDVFRAIGSGRTTKEIAAHLNLSISTVDTYRERLRTKLDIKHSAELAHRATVWVLEQSEADRVGRAPER